MKNTKVKKIDGRTQNLKPNIKNEFLDGKTMS